MIIISVIIISFSRKIEENENMDKNSTLFGNALISIAQITTAFQLIFEEYFLDKHADLNPLYFVGIEGLWGSLLTAILILILSHIKSDTRPGGTVENLSSIFNELKNDNLLILFILLNMICVGFLNFFGMNITKYANATVRTILDTGRNIFIYSFSVIVGWEQFTVTKLFGLFILIIGICIYNEILKLPNISYEKKDKSNTMDSPLLVHSVSNEQLL